MTLAKNILGIVPGLQATALVGYNLKQAKNIFNPKMKKNQTKQVIRMGVTNLIGISLIKPTAKLISGL